MEVSGKWNNDLMIIKKFANIHNKQITEEMETD